MLGQGKVKNIHWKPAQELSSVDTAAEPDAEPDAAPAAEPLSEGPSKDNMLKRSVA